MTYFTNPDSDGAVLDVSPLTTAHKVHIGIEDANGETMAVWIDNAEALRVADAIREAAAG